MGTTPNMAPGDKRAHLEQRLKMAYETREIFERQNAENLKAQDEAIEMIRAKIAALDDEPPPEDPDHVQP